MEEIMTNIVPAGNQEHRTIKDNIYQNVLDDILFRVEKTFIERGFSCPENHNIVEVTKCVIEFLKLQFNYSFIYDLKGYDLVELSDWVVDESKLAVGYFKGLEECDRPGDSLFLYIRIGQSRAEEMYDNGYLGPDELRRITSFIDSYVKYGVFEPINIDSVQLDITIWTIYMYLASPEGDPMMGLLCPWYEDVVYYCDNYRITKELDIIESHEKGQLGGCAACIDLGELYGAYYVDEYYNADARRYSPPNVQEHSRKIHETEMEVCEPTVISITSFSKEECRTCGRILPCTEPAHFERGGYCGSPCYNECAECREKRIKSGEYPEDESYFHYMYRCPKVFMAEVNKDNFSPQTAARVLYDYADSGKDLGKYNKYLNVPFELLEKVLRGMILKRPQMLRVISARVLLKNECVVNRYGNNPHCELDYHKIKTWLSWIEQQGEEERMLLGEIQPRRQLT